MANFDTIILPGTASTIPSNPSRPTLLNVVARRSQLRSSLSNPVDKDDSVTLIGGTDRLQVVCGRPRAHLREPYSNRVSVRRRSRSYGHKYLSNEVVDTRPRTSSIEMTEISGSFGQEDTMRLQQPLSFHRNSGIRRRIASSAMTISRGNSVDASPVLLNPTLPEVEVDTFVDMATQPIAAQRLSNQYSEMTEDANVDSGYNISRPSSVFDAHPSPPPRFHQKQRKSEASDRASLVNGSSLEQRSSYKDSVRHRLGQMFARSTPDINMEANPQTALQVDKLLNRLRAFEKGNLPKIPQELLAVFPQNLPRHDFTIVEKLWNQITSNEGQDGVAVPINSNRKSNDQQLSAIMELLHTEARYIKTLEMIIDVHIAVYLDLTKSTSWSHDFAYRSGSLSRLAAVAPPLDSMVPMELAPTAVTPSSPSGGGRFRERVRRFRGRGNHDSASSSSSLSNLSAIPLTDLPGFSAAPFRDVFGDIGSVYAVNQRFWTDCFEPGIINESFIDVKFCIRSMKKAFSQFRNYFQPYIDFLETYGTLISNIKYLDENNKFFSIYHEWTKLNNPLNSRESLTGLLAQPFQRLTRYGVLIRRIKECTTDEYEVSALTEILAAVDDFVKEVNFNQPEEEARTKLNNFIQRIRKYSFADTVRSDFSTELPVVSADIGSILRQPMRINGRSRTRKPIAEVQAKVKHVGGKVTDALCVLLSDMILVCKQSVTKKHLNVYRPPILLDHLTIQPKRDNPGNFVGFVTNDLGLLVDSYLFFSEAKDLEEWISKVLRQKIEMFATRHSASMKCDSFSSSSHSRSNTVGSLDGLVTSSTIQPRKHEYYRYNSSYDGHPPAPPTPFVCNRVAPRRCSEARQRAFYMCTDSSTPSVAVIGRPQQQVDSAVVLPRQCRPSIYSLSSSLTTENANIPLEGLKNGSSSGVAKSASSASDSSVTSYESASASSGSTTTNTTTTTTSGESLGSGKFNYLNHSVSPNVTAVPTIDVKLRTRHSFGKEGFDNGAGELVKTDSVQKRLTS